MNIIAALFEASCGSSNALKTIGSTRAGGAGILFEALRIVLSLF